VPDDATKAAIFDVDGTLVDSVDLHARAWVEALGHFGHEVSFAAARSQIGKGGDQLLPVFLPPEVVAARGEEIQEFRGTLFKRDYLDRVRGFPGVRALFERVIAAGLRPVLASSAKGDELQVYERAAGIADLVRVETSSDDAERTKPFPDIFRAALDRAGAAASQAVVVGDSPFDAQAAGGAGITAVGVLCGGFPEADLRAAGCTEIFAGPEDLLARFEGSALARLAAT